MSPFYTRGFSLSILFVYIFPHLWHLAIFSYSLCDASFSHSFPLFYSIKVMTEFLWKLWSKKKRWTVTRLDITACYQTDKISVGCCSAWCTSKFFQQFVLIHEEPLGVSRLPKYTNNFPRWKINLNLLKMGALVNNKFFVKKGMFILAGVLSLLGIIFNSVAMGTDYWIVSGGSRKIMFPFL